MFQRELKANQKKLRSAQLAQRRVKNEWNKPSVNGPT
jgi:hypothetical protein